MRGSIPEECIPLSGRSNTSRGLPPKDVLEFVLPDLNLSCLRYANSDTKTTEQLLKLDEQGVSGAAENFYVNSYRRAIFNVLYIHGDGVADMKDI